MYNKYCLIYEINSVVTYREMYRTSLLLPGDGSARLNPVIPWDLRTISRGYILVANNSVWNIIIYCLIS